MLASELEKVRNVEKLKSLTPEVRPGLLPCSLPVSLIHRSATFRCPALALSGQ